MDQVTPPSEALKKLDMELRKRINRAISDATLQGKNEVNLCLYVDSSCKKRCRQLIIEAGYDCSGKDDEYPVFFIDTPVMQATGLTKSAEPIASAGLIKSEELNTSDRQTQSAQPSSVPQKSQSDVTICDEKDDTD